MAIIYVSTGLPTTPIQSYQFLTNNLFGGLSTLPTLTLSLNTLIMDFGAAAAFGGGFTAIQGDGALTFPGGSFDPGEIPMGLINSVEGYAGPRNNPFLLVSVSGFSLTWTQLLGGGINGLLGGRDNLSGSDGDDRIAGFAGNDNIGGGAGKDTLYGGGGDDDILTYGSGDDDLYGGAGNDRVKASLGDDYLNGGFGNDTLAGASGADTFLGGGGADQFDFRANLSDDGLPSGVGALRDRILDFEVGTDKINLDGYNGGTDLVFQTGLAFTGSFQFRLVTLGADTVVRVNLGGTLAPEFDILVKGVTNLTVTDFIL